jgi:hypothetical protein
MIVAWFSPLHDLIAFVFCSGRREECLMVRKTFDLSALSTYGLGQFCNHPGHRFHAKIWIGVVGVLLL